MKRTIPTILLCSVLSLAGCPPKEQPAHNCKAADAGDTTLDTPCVGQPDGAACCIGAQKGTCQSSRCVAN